MGYLELVKKLCKFSDLVYLFFHKVFVTVIIDRRHTLDFMISRNIWTVNGWCPGGPGLWTLMTSYTSLAMDSSMYDGVKSDDVICELSNGFWYHFYHRICNEFDHEIKIGCRTLQVNLIQWIDRIRYIQGIYVCLTVKLRVGCRALQTSQPHTMNR